MMDDLDLLDELHELTAQLGIELRISDGSFSGGICRLRGKRVLLLNASLPRKLTIELICRELSRQDLSKVFVLPAVRAKIEALN